MAITESQKKYESKRARQCKTYAIKYCLYQDTENAENERLKRYLSDNNISANSYIKGLIKTDLDSKGVPYENDMSVSESAAE